MSINRHEILPRSIFRAYDIRGIVDQTLTESGVYLIGKGLGSLLLQKNEYQISVARDGRLSGPKLVKALIDGILSSGCHVLDIGMVPTPLLYYAANVLDQRSGVMLTGSHNPADYNGLKIMVQGAMLAGEGLFDLYQRIIENRFNEGKGTYSERNMVDQYVNYISRTVTVNRPLRIVVDAGNGVTGKIAPALYSALGCEVIELYCEIDGRFPYHHPDPTDAKNLQDLILCVRENKADIGLAFDGDGDRLGIVTNDGEIINADRLLMLYAKALLAYKPGAKIIYDVKCTYHLADLIRAYGGEPIIWCTGHSLIKAKLAETQADLAGEMSGHFFFKDRWFGFDDALYAGARLLEILAAERKTSDEIFAAIPNSFNTPELRVKVKEEEKFALMHSLITAATFNDAKDILTIDGLRVNFHQGWGLVRPSNTSPYLILRFEASDETTLKNIQTLFRTWMLSVKPDLDLPF